MMDTSVKFYERHSAESEDNSINNTIVPEFGAGATSGGRADQQN